MPTEADDATTLETDLGAEATIEHIEATPKRAPAPAAQPAVREADILPGFWRSRITLAPDSEGDVEATLVGMTSPVSSGRAVLYVHGFVDYFFQAHMAEAFRSAGIDFYAVDLRKYGRSLRPYQTPNSCRSVDEYFEEIDEAIRIIRAEGNERLLLAGHSTGGLIAPLYAHERRSEGTVDALFLNSPFFEFNAGWLARASAIPALAEIGGRDPYRATPLTLSPLYGQSLHKDYRGVWDYRLDWKPIEGFLPITAGWVHAIHDGHVRLHAGIDVGCPALVMCSSRSIHTETWDDGLYGSDAVLNVEQIRRWTDALGSEVTQISIDGGVHDLTLSVESVREHVFGELFRWCSAYF
jgi:alpha-beta hydrolase superfamily lysophospholipase